MKERIYGTETEYAIQYYAPRKPSPHIFMRMEINLFDLLNHALDRLRYQRLSEDENHSDRVFLENGARFYMDRGNHPEYSTPECLAVRDVVAHEEAGERILADLLPLVQNELHDMGYPGELSIYKNNVDTSGCTYGWHENYLMERKTSLKGEDTFFRYVTKILIPFLVTRQIFCGTGKIDVKYPFVSASYQISQRADYISTEISSTTSSRGIIN
ncbi:MAG: proteasome accessory factor PafA2 family protein, partial [Candidatus Tectomicrobia bacterium]|nr:proteasome accessory factor PafA2 family protein [Candidatus Tectomicrobia bacterium]